MDAREQLGGMLRVTHRGRSMIVGLAEGRVALPAIGQQRAAWLHRCLDEPTQRRRGDILDDGEPDAARAAAAHFDRTDDDGLVAVALAPAAAPLLDPADVGLVHFHGPREAVSLRA